MLASAVFIVTFLTLRSLANICTTPHGNWSYELATGVTDFAISGVALNRRYFCFYGCLNTHCAVQNYKVKLINETRDAAVIKVERAIAISDFIKNTQRVSKNQDDDPQARYCQDPRVLNIVKTAIQRSPIDNCTSVANMVLLNINRRNWAVVCTRYAGKTPGFVMSLVYEDYASCEYLAERPFSGIVYHVKAAQIDIS